MPAYRSSLLFGKCQHCLKYLSKPFGRSISTKGKRVPLPPNVLYTSLTTRRLISLHGQDAHHFLQGLVTSNIPPAPQLQSHYSAFLNASGRVLHDVFIYPATQSKDYRDTFLRGNEEPALLIEVDAHEVESLAKHLKRFKLRAKVAIDVVDEGDFGVWHIWGGQAHENDSIEENGDLWCADNRAPDMGYRLLGSPKRRPEGEGESTSQQYHLRRIVKGVAEGQNEIVKELALPQESNIDYMGGIDFRKGCYVGQELTIRVHHTGIVRKRILPVQIYDKKRAKPSENLRYEPTLNIELPVRNADISRAEKKGRSAGKWLGGVGNIGLALCRLDVMTDTALTAEGNHWVPENEFKLAWGSGNDGVDNEVMVKAFVPDWHQIRAEAQSSRRRRNP